MLSLTPIARFSLVGLLPLTDLPPQSRAPFVSVPVVSVPFVSVPFRLVDSSRLSTLRQEIRPGVGEESQPRPFAVGNGRVFAAVELGTTAAVAGRVLGLGDDRAPEDPDALRGRWSFEIAMCSTSCEPIEFSTQRIVRLRRASCVATEVVSRAGVLRTVTFAPARGSSILHALEFEARTEAESRPGSDSLSITARLAHGSTSTVRTIELGSLDRGTRWRGAFSIDAGDRHAAGDPEFTLVPVRGTIAAARTLLAAEGDAKAASSRATEYSTDHPILADILDATGIDLRVLHSARIGLPVSIEPGRQRGLEELAGILLAQLRFGLWSEAAGLLRAIHEATRNGASVPSSLADPSSNRGPSPVDWNRGIEEEAPSWVVVAHYWYWRATRDTGLIRRHRRLLESCLPSRNAKVPVTAPLPDSVDRALLQGGQSFRTEVLKLLAIQGYGELRSAIAAIDSGPTVEARIQRQFRRRVLDRMRAVEEGFWLEESGHFAPALRRDGTPVRAIRPTANLFPSLVGWTYASSDRHRRNVTRSLSVADGRRLDAGRLSACADLDDPRLWSCLETAIEELAVRAVSEPGRLGFLLDATLYALTGIRHASVPGFDAQEIRLRPRLPPGATRFGVVHHRKDGRDLSLRFREELHWLSLEEERSELGLSPDRRHDPRRRHRQLRVEVELHAGRPREGDAFEVFLQSDEKLCLRWLSVEHGDAFRRLDERVYLTPNR